MSAAISQKKGWVVLIALLSVIAAGLCFCWPATNLLAQPRGQGVKKTAAGAANAGGAEPRFALAIGNGAY